MLPLQLIAKSGALIVDNVIDQPAGVALGYFNDDVSFVTAPAGLRAPQQRYSHFRQIPVGFGFSREIRIGVFLRISKWVAVKIRHLIWMSCGLCRLAFQLLKQQPIKLSSEKSPSKLYVVNGEALVVRQVECVKRTDRP